MLLQQQTDVFVCVLCCPLCASAVLFLQSFVRELQLFVGPLFTVRTNSVGSVVQVHSCPKSAVDIAFAEKVKRWLVTIGA